MDWDTGGDVDIYFSNWRLLRMRIIIDIVVEGCNQLVVLVKPTETKYYKLLQFIMPYGEHL